MMDPTTVTEYYTEQLTAFRYEWQRVTTGQNWLGEYHARREFNDAQEKDPAGAYRLVKKTTTIEREVI